MSDIPQVVAAIDRRLADIAAEIGALDAARAQLAAPRTVRQAPADRHQHRRSPVAASNGAPAPDAVT